MKRIQSTDAVAVLPAASESGTTGYFTNGDPGGGVPATTVQAEWLNRVQEEIAGVVEGAGLTLNGANNGQLLAAIQALNGIAGSAQCRLSISGGNVKLSPYNGNLLNINGAAKVVPSAGVTLSASGAANSTLYYIYAYMVSTTMTLERSTTGYEINSTTGMPQKTGDATRRLVGMARTNGSAAWELVRSFFSDPGVVVRSNFTAERSSAGVTSYTEINSEIRCGFLAWADEIIDVTSAGTIRIDAASGRDFFHAIGIDGTVQDAFTQGDGSGSANITASLSISVSGLSEGYHYATIMGKGELADFNGHYAGGATAGERTTLQVTCPRR